MRRVALALYLSVAFASATWSEDTVQIEQPVRLDGAGALDRLRQTNPNHYVRAQRIIAAANELCRPGPEAIQFARFDASDISCEGSFLRTSKPPKREISFTLDTTKYVALVVVTDSPPTNLKVEYRQKANASGSAK